MSLEGKSHKRKSGAAYRREKKAKIDEERKLGSFMLNFLQTTETDTPAVLDLTRDIRNDRPVVALVHTSAHIHDDSLPTISCLESWKSVATPPFTGTPNTPVDGNSHDYSDSEVAEASALTPFSIDSNPETFCVEMPAITPTVDACKTNHQ